MIENVDHIIIAVEDLESAEDNYTKIFGIEPVWRGFHNELGTSNVLFNFENTYLELLAATGSGIGAEMVNNTIEKKGDGLLGLAASRRHSQDNIAQPQRRSDVQSSLILSRRDHYDSLC